MLLAPVVLFVYNRPEHTRATIDALRKNIEACSSDLIIYSDAARSQKDEVSVGVVRKYLREVDGFKSVKIVERSENFGLSKSVIQGVTEVVNLYERVIVLEDDLVTSPHFLNYMNSALDKYAPSEEVISIHGYTYRTKLKLPETFFLRGADCWGWATWKRGWALLDTDGVRLLHAIRESNEVSRFNLNDSYPYISMLEDQIAGKNNSWAILWYASAFVKGKLTLYPGKSLVRNLGNDGSGTHSTATEAYNVDLSDTPIDVENPEPDLEDNQSALEAFSDFFHAYYSKGGILRRLAKKVLKWD